MPYSYHIPDTFLLMFQEIVKFRHNIYIISTVSIGKVIEITCYRVREHLKGSISTRIQLIDQKLMVRSVLQNLIHWSDIFTLRH